ncbi:hypothetical protein BRYFOR_05282 [Marvinbryantia formatexigens DSM 14469]|uniref:Uncharacterized protein n=1 Tax=Marvinbryantia formatexigens DSM 14469 TaxID=478749 RepID=C6L9J2_9FIRM|nr:hypothetical protein BRYFOR_05282 [Marvinbryantia formatexigens DSM 14469]
MFTSAFQSYCSGVSHAAKDRLPEQAVPGAVNAHSEYAGYL